MQIVFVHMHSYFSKRYRKALVTRPQGNMSNLLKNLPNWATAIPRGK